MRTTEKRNATGRQPMALETKPEGKALSVYFSSAKVPRQDASARIVRDFEIDDKSRKQLSEYTTPRIALDGSPCWLLDEIDSGSDDDE